MKKYVFSGTLAIGLLFTVSCFAEIQPMDLGLTWISSNSLTGYFVDNIIVSKDKKTIKGDFYLWRTNDGYYLKWDGKLDYKKKKFTLYEQKTYAIQDGSLIFEDRPKTIANIKIKSSLGSLSMADEDVHPFASRLAAKYGISYKRPQD